MSGLGALTPSYPPTLRVTTVLCIHYITFVYSFHGCPLSSPPLPCPCYTPLTTVVNLHVGFSFVLVSYIYPYSSQSVSNISKRFQNSIIFPTLKSLLSKLSPLSATMNLPILLISQAERSPDWVDALLSLHEQCWEYFSLPTSHHQATTKLYLTAEPLKINSIPFQGNLFLLSLLTWQDCPGKILSKYKACRYMCSLCSGSVSVIVSSVWYWVATKTHPLTACASLGKFLKKCVDGNWDKQTLADISWPQHSKLTFSQRIFSLSIIQPWILLDIMTSWLLPGVLAQTTTVWVSIQPAYNVIY